MMTRGGTFMKERPTEVSVSPKSSETDPPAANQPEGGGDLGKDSNAKTNETKPTAAGANERQAASSKPDGEVDTGA
jgi:hypothetical protein